MKDKVQPLFTEKKVHHTHFPNRYVVAPMTRISAADNGIATDRMKHYYERFAAGGFGAVITEGIYPDKSYSQGYANQPGLADENHRDAWKPIIQGVQKHGTRIIAQIMHAGAQSQGNAYKDQTIAPSEVAPKGDQLSFYGGNGAFSTPRAMNKEDIVSVKKAFATSARLAKEAGFDGVEIHGANGYLIDQFLTDYFNQREDEYGGVTKNRLRFALEVIEEVRQAVGSDYLVGIRISQGKASDGEHRWALGETDARTIFGDLGDSSLNFIHVTDKDGTQPGFGEGSMSMAAAAKTFSGLPVIANGQLQDPEKAARLINGEEADFISLGTSALQNPDAPDKIRRGESLEAFDFQSIMLPQADIKEQEWR